MKLWNWFNKSTERLVVLTISQKNIPTQFMKRFQDNAKSPNTYRKVASTNASRFEARLVYMHTKNDIFLIRSSSRL